MFAEDVNVNLLAVEMAKQSSTMESMARDVADMSQIITGNGTPELGMVVRQIKMQENVERIRDDNFRAHEAINKNIDIMQKDLDEFARASPGVKNKNGSKIIQQLDKFIPPHIRSTFWLVLIRGLVLVFGAGQLLDFIPIKQ